MVTVDGNEKVIGTSLGGWLIDYRHCYKLTQTDLAEKLQVSQPVIARLESGDYEPRLATLRSLSGKLGMSIAIEITPGETVTHIRPKLSK